MSEAINVSEISAAFSKIWLITSLLSFRLSVIKLTLEII